MKQTVLLALAVAGASASSRNFNKRQLFDVPEEGTEEYFNMQIDNICRPRNSTGSIDLNAPCNALMAIQYQCMYGPDVLDQLTASMDDMYDDEYQEAEDPTLQSNETQRACICQSQHNDMLAGCVACFKEHGSTDSETEQVNIDKIKSDMEKYCKADEPATQGFADVLWAAGDDTLTETVSSSSAEATFGTLSDPIGNTTDVSLYFTPSVTGTAAYIPAIPTPESSGVNATYTSVSTSGGQIVPTAAGSNGQSEQSSGSEGSGSASSTESDSGAVQTAMAQAGVVGAMGMAALMAAL